MIVSVHQPQYIPWLGYIDKIARSDHFVFLDCVQYKEREFQNRNRIRTDRGWMWLTVPVISTGKGRQLFSEVLIDNSFRWKQKHWDTWQTFYGKAPFFEVHRQFFEDTYSQKWEKLMDLNIHVIRHILNCLSISTAISFESELKTSNTKTERIIEICKKLKASTYLSGSGGRDYLDESRFEDESIDLEYQHFTHPVYQQQFMKDEEDFLPYLSVLDLLLNEGPDSRQVMGYK